MTDEKLKKELTAEKLAEAYAGLVKILKSQGVRVAAQTIMPRMGSLSAIVISKYDDTMEAERVKFNTWLRTCQLFDYLYDTDEVVKAKDNPIYMDTRLHAGGSLHPNDLGGKAIAEACDLKKLIGQ